MSPVLTDKDCPGKVAMGEVGEDKVPNLPGKSRHLKLLLLHVKSLLSSQAATCFPSAVHTDLPDEDDLQGNCINQALEFQMLITLVQ